MIGLLLSLALSNMPPPPPDPCKTADAGAPCKTRSWSSGACAPATCSTVTSDGQPAKAPCLQCAPNTLSGAVVHDSFGVGTDADPVRFTAVQQQAFEFTWAPEHSSVAVIHYQAREISVGEVVVRVNGSDIGNVPADTMGSADRTFELLVPTKLLKKNAPNTVVFVNTHHPAETWRVWNLSLEVAALPETTSPAAGPKK